MARHPRAEDRRGGVKVKMAGGSARGLALSEDPGEALRPAVDLRAAIERAHVSVDGRGTEREPLCDGLFGGATHEQVERLLEARREGLAVGRRSRGADFRRVKRIELRVQQMR